MRKGRSKLAVRIGGKIINPAQLGFPKVAYGRLTLTDLDRPTDLRNRRRGGRGRGRRGEVNENIDETEY